MCVVKELFYSDTTILQTTFCDDSCKASVCLAQASTLVNYLVKDKLQWKKNTKIDGRMHLFLDGTDEEATQVRRKLLLWQLSTEAVRKTHEEDRKASKT